MISLAFYWNERDNQAITAELSWAELAATLTADTPSDCTAVTCTGKKCLFKSNSTEDTPGAWSPVIIEGLRANHNVDAVTAMVLDGDGISADQLELVAERVRGLNFIVHTTHRHRPGVNFIRLVLELSRPVLAVEWSRFYVQAIKHLGFEGIFDPLKDLSRLYFFPTHPCDVPFLSDVGEGEPLDVDAILAAPPIIDTTAKVIQSTLEEDGCADALKENFTDFNTVLSHLTVYRRTRAHSSDPYKKEKADLIGLLLMGKPLAAPGGNAEPPPIEPPVDLPKGRGFAITRVMAILTGYLPLDTPEDVYMDLFRNSITAMCFGRQTDRVEMEEQLMEKLRIGRQRRQSWEEEAQARNTKAKAFQQARLEERERLRAEKNETTETEDDQWISKLQTSADGESLVNSAFNAYVIVKHASEFVGHLRWDDVNLCVVSTGMFANVEPEVLGDVIANYLSSKWGLNFNNSMAVLRQVLVVAYENRFDPIRDYLRSVIWDGVSRVDGQGGWLAQYANVTSTPFSIKAGRKWMVGSVARGLNPGCKHDCVLVLEGPQGKRKSTLFRVLGGEYYSALSLTVADKDSKMVAARSWISELPDLAALKKVSEINALKAFFSTEEDVFRPPYGRAPIKSKRRNSFAGTTNEDSYLVDPTGNRRYLTVKCNGTTIDLNKIIRDRDQLWAESVVLYDKHINECEDKTTCGCWWFRDDEAGEVEEEANERVQESSIKMMIEDWWEMLPMDARPREFTTLTIAQTVMELTPEKINDGILTRIGIAVIAIGFRKCRKRSLEEGKKVRRWYYEPTEELLVLPQSEAGKRMKFKVIKGGIEGKKIEPKKPGDADGA